MYINRRLVAVPFALAVAGLALSGCSSNSSASSSTTSTASASSSSTSASSSSAATGETVKADVVVGQAQAAIAKAGSFTMTSVNAQGTTTTNVELKNGVANLSGEVASGMSMIAMNNGQQMYIKSPLTKGDWALLSKTSKTPGIKQMASMLEGIQPQINPMAGMSLYEATGTLTKAGTETINGASATHYVGKLPVEAVIKVMPAEMRPLMTQSLGKDPIPLDLYVDAQGRLVASKMTVTAAGQASTVESKYTNYGKVFNIVAPKTFVR